MEASSRGIYRGQVTKLVKAATENLKFPEYQVIPGNSQNFDEAEEEISVMLDRLVAARESLNQANQAVKSTVKAEEFDKENEAILEYEDKAIAAIARLKARLAKIRQVRSEMNAYQSPNSVSPNQSNVKCTKLQKLTLRQFSGDYKDWLPFWEQFKATVHENSSINGAEKFSYLQSVLTGRAAQTIEGFQPTQACYDGAIALLLEEYGDTEKMVDRYMQQLMSIPPVSSRHDCNGLRRLYNAVISATRSLTALGISPTHYNIMLKSILLKCLPTDLRVDFFRSYEDSNHGEDENRSGSQENLASQESVDGSIEFAGDKQVKALLKFLKVEISSLEKSEQVKPKREAHSFKAYNTATGLLNPNETSGQCVFCCSKQHQTRDCNGSLSVLERKEMLMKGGRCLKCAKRGHQVRKCYAKHIKCAKCGGNYMSSLCDPRFEAKLTRTQQRPNLRKGNLTTKDEGTQGDKTLNLYSTSSPNLTQVFLQTACALISSPKRSKQPLFVRIVLDGGSQRTYVKQSVSKRLNLPIIRQENVRVVSFGNKSGAPPQLLNVVQLIVSSQYDANKFIWISAIEIPEICMDVMTMPNASNEEFSRFQLADARIYGVPENGISLLIGSDFYWEIVSGKFQRITKNLTAVESMLGWTIQGPALNTNIQDYLAERNETTLHVSDYYSDDNAENLWNLDVLGISSEIHRSNSDDDLKYIQREGKRYKAKLLWRNNDIKPAVNREGALIRFHRLIRKLSRDEHQFLAYDKAMQEYISTGIAERVGICDNNYIDSYFMPHRAVIREDKTTTKLRIVFDASSKTADNLSLNDCLLAGPNLLPNALSILLNFRLRAIGIVADIRKAFLQVSLDNNERNYHKFFWFKEPLTNLHDLPELEEYRMTRVTFGVKCSPYLLGATIRTHIKRNAGAFPETCQLLLNAFYMDDLILSVDTTQNAAKLYNDTVGLMLEASMQMQKWNSNDLGLLKKINVEAPPNQKVLGLCWFVSKDEIAVDLEFLDVQTRNLRVNATKREVLKFLGRFFDPIGILGPSTVRIKILFQRCWQEKLGWDQPLPETIMQTWRKYCDDFHHLKKIYLPRNVIGLGTPTTIQLHLFADASPQAYGAVAYVRCVNNSGSSSVRYLCSKNRVSPISKSGRKELTLPKLELSAALVAARLQNYIKRNLQIRFDQTFMWSDSKITICWIQRASSKQEPYVASRVSEISDLTESNEWRHCSGASNPADLLTRGLTGQQLANSSIWLSGPEWLSHNESKWPSQIDSTTLMVESLLENRETSTTKPEPFLDINKFSNFKRLLRISAYVLRFLKNLKSTTKIRSKGLIANEINMAEEYWIKQAQLNEYADEIRSLRRNKSVSLSSKILTLNPILDENGVVRAATRLQSTCDNDYAVVYPIILPKHSYFTKLLIIDTHERTLHCGVNIVLSQVRERFWIPQGRQLIKTILKQCLVCRRLKGKAAAPPFAPLPKQRLCSTRAFETIGVDIAGPLHVKLSPHDTGTTKVYILLMTCAVVRAIHLELTFSLSAESCLLAMRRFFSRRGVPNTIISDNAKYFKRMSRDLAEFDDFLQSDELNGFIAENRITWQFIVERAPWWGGFYERLVQSVKNILRATIGRKILTSDELHTYLTEAENVINLRPLTYVGDNPKDLMPLTPANFLNGIFLKSFVSGQPINKNEICQLWKSRLRFSHQFWKRWRREYLNQLRSAHHHRRGMPCNYKAGDVVLLHDDSLPRIFWRLALIENVFPGRDGKLRVCEVRLANGTRLRRAVQHLYPMEMDSSNVITGRPEDVENIGVQSHNNCDQL